VRGEIMKSTVKTTVKNGTRIICMDDEIFELRRKIWRTIHKEGSDLSDCDVAMALGIVQYELIHHTKGN
jgi:hypothetical protein